MSDTKIDTLQLNIESNSSRAYAEIDKLATSLSNLTTASAKLNVVANRLTKLNTALAGLKTSSSGLSKLSQISNALNGLESVGSAKGLNSTINALRKIPELTQQLNSNTLNKFSKEMKALGNILEPISTKLNSVGSGVKNLSSSLNKTNISKFNQDLKQTNSTISNTSKSASLLKKLFNLTAIIYGLKQLTNGIAKSVNSINAYIENMNLFNVSMGKFGAEAKEYAELLQDKMGIDSSEWMRNQGVFMSMATGFGLANDKAYELSKGMTELSYDMSSFYNIPITEALTKMRSALAGEIEPLRALGISLTEAQLKEMALAKGITKSVESMTESEKATLRYVAIVEKASAQGVIGDFARTLESPANALRILQQQFTQLGRAIGSVFLPIIAQVMPYVQAFVKVLTNAISKLAVFFGFTMPKWDNKSWESGATSVGATADALGGATAKAKEYKKSLQGFDELNIIPAQQEASGGSGASGGAGGDLGLDIKSVWDESLISSISTQTDEIVAKFQTLGLKIKEAFSTQTVQDFLMVLGSLAVGFGALAIVGTVASKVAELGGIATILAPLKTLIGNIAVHLQAIVILFNTSGITGVLSAIASILAPMIGIVLGVASVVYVLWENFDKVVQVVQGFIEKIQLKEKFEGIMQSLQPLMTAIAGLTDLFTFVGTVILTALQPAIAIVVGAFNGFITAIQPIIMLVTGIIQIIGALGTFLVGVFTGDLNKCSEAIRNIWNGIVNIFVGGISAVVGFVSGFVSGVIQWFTNLWDVLVGHSIVPDMVNAIIQWFKNMVTNVVNAVSNFVGNIVNWFINLHNRVTNTIIEIKNNIVNKVKEIWTAVKNWFNSNVAPKFTVSYWVNKFNGFKEGFVQSVKNMLNAGIDMINKFIRWLNSKLKFSWDGLSILGKQIFPGGSVQLVRIPEITQRFADGGFIEDGLFTMNKGEIAGEFSNGKSVVANNQQIIAGISQGVYEAMVRANGNGKEISINVYPTLDGKAIGESFIKYHNGKVQQTGVSPLAI
ncbi:hypothetical protein [Methanobrevibacter sp.]|uniref:hypothetical protein n=1 Tax=Methanobrevibacter sp. TaxID=66852 RepID=UPI0038902089